MTRLRMTVLITLLLVVAACDGTLPDGWLPDGDPPTDGPPTDGPPTGGGDGGVLWTLQLGAEAHDCVLALAETATGELVVVRAAGTVCTLGPADEIGAGALVFETYEADGSQIDTITVPNDTVTLATAAVAGDVVVVAGRSAAAGYDGLVVESYDLDGTPGWTWDFNASGTERLFGVALVPDGSVYLAGYISGTFPGQTQHTEVVGGTDMVLVKLSASGELLWARQHGTEGTTQAYGVATDDAGNAYVSGDSSGDFTGHEGATALAPGPFLTRFDANGDHAWTYQFATEHSGYANLHSVAVAGTQAFIAGIDRAEDAPADAHPNDVYVRSFDLDGEPGWLVRFGSDGNDVPLAIAATADGELLITGNTTDAFDDYENLGGTDVFVAQVGQDGEVLGVTQFGTDEADSAHVLAPASDGGSVYVGGWTQGAFEGEVNGGGADVVVVRVGL